MKDKNLMQSTDLCVSLLYTDKYDESYCNKKYLVEKKQQYDAYKLL